VGPKKAPIRKEEKKKKDGFYPFEEKKKGNLF